MSVWREKLRDMRGQGTVEYVLVLAAFASVLLGLGALAKVLGGGVFVDHALFSASHATSEDALAQTLDIFLF